MPPQPLRYGQGHRYDSGLRFGQLLPDPPKPAARHRTVTQTYTPTHPMLTYPFSTRTGTQNQVTTTRASRGTKTTAEVLAEIQTRIGAAPLTIALIVQTLHEVILDWTTEAWTIEPLHDLLGYFLPCGGSFPDTDFQPGLDAMNMKPACNWGDAGRARVVGSITFENQGHQGRVVPVIIRIVDNWTNQADHYTAAKSVRLELGNLKSKIEFDRTKGCKVQFRKADNSLVDATDYGPAGSTRFISAQVPAGTTGTLGEVVVTMLINGTLRSGSYTTPLTP